MRHSGLFISFEGGEGAGKSTQIRLLTRFLKENDFNCVLTREPGGTAFGEKLRKIHKTMNLDPLSELFLVEASRARHVQEVILPALQKKKIVVCDRFGESTLVYQGIVGKLDLSLIREFNAIATQGLKPDLIFWLDVAWSKAKERLKSRTKTKDRFDQASRLFHERLRKGYQKLAKIQRNPKLIRIDASQSIEEIHEEIVGYVEKCLKRKKRWN